MPYTIEEGIPVPPVSKHEGGNWRGPQSEWARIVNALEPGQSVLTPEYREFKNAEQIVLRNRPKRYAIRKVAGQGWRVWRVE